MRSHKAQHAVVIGGSIAGLCAARVLADHYAQVTIVERDELLQATGIRSGVPQARHGHVLLMEGRRLLDRLFPGFTNEMLQRGALLLDWGADCRIYNVGNWMPRFASGIATLFMSRPLVEEHIRQRVLRIPRIAIHTGVVTQLVMDGARERVIGVRVAARADRADEAVLTADLVVDASGRDSHLPEWLAEHGYTAPDQTIINAGVGYASRIYQAAPAGTHDWQFLVVRGTAPHDLRAGTIIPLENQQWMVTLSGSGKDYPPTDEAGFLAFVQSLAQPTLYDALKQAKPRGRIYGYRRTENSIRHYERLARLPSDLVILGDAACAFNPVYGQGMTSSVIAAITLDQSLRRYQRRRFVPRQPFERYFQQQLARRNAACWTIATTDDYRVPTVEGPTPSFTTRLAHRYLDAVIQQSARSRFTYLTFSRVLHLLQSPLTLLHPSIVVRIIFGSIKLPRLRKPVRA